MKNETAEIIIQLIREFKPESVEKLADLAKEKLPSLTEHEIVECVIRLQNEGKIALREPVELTPQNLKTYLQTKKARWFWTTMALTLATVAVVFAIPENAFPLVYIRYVLGTIFVLWLPGYTFIKALFPKENQAQIKTTTNLDTVERIALSIGLSLALVPLVGLLLNYTPWGIRLTPIVLGLLALTTVFATVAVAREHQSRIRKST